MRQVKKICCCCLKEKRIFKDWTRSESSFQACGTFLESNILNEKKSKYYKKKMCVHTLCNHIRTYWNSYIHKYYLRETEMKYVIVLLHVCNLFFLLCVRAREIIQENTMKQFRRTTELWVMEQRNLSRLLFVVLSQKKNKKMRKWHKTNAVRII